MKKIEKIKGKVVDGAKKANGWFNKNAGVLSVAGILVGGIALLKALTKSDG